MPVAVNFSGEDQPALHEDAVGWEYKKVNDTRTHIVLLDGDDERVAELMPENVNQITPLSEEEFEEAVDLIQ